MADQPGTGGMIFFWHKQSKQQQTRVYPSPLKKTRNFGMKTGGSCKFLDENRLHVGQTSYRWVQSWRESLFQRRHGGTEMQGGELEMEEVWLTNTLSSIGEPDLLASWGTR